MRAWLVTLLCTLASPAFADGYAGLTAGLEGVSSLAGFSALGVELGHRIAGSDVGYRGGFLAGGMLGDEVHGGILMVRGGVEYRPECRHGCVYAGVDLAVMYGQVIDDPETTTTIGLLAIPRAGIDIGSDLHVRLGLELLLGAGRVHDQLMPRDTTAIQTLGGFGFTGGFGGVF